MPKKLLFSVTRNDFEMQTFSVGGPGGGGKDTSNSAVRLIHRSSGEGRETRSNTQNRKAAFMHLVNPKKFKDWHKLECARKLGQKVPETPEEILARVDKMIEDGLRDGSIVVEEY